MSLLRGVGARLSLALALVVAGALGIVYLIVVPSLEGRLVDAKEASLRSALPAVAAGLPSDSFKWPDYVDVTSFRVSARVVVYAVDSVAPTSLRVVGDSRGATSRDVADDALAIRAAEEGRLVTATVPHDGARYAESAMPAQGRQVVVLLQRSLADSLSNIRLVERRLVLAGLIALGVALAIGFGGAAVFARRLRRLERAADRIAHGRFDDPVSDTGGDELGQLARAFEDMRVRLQGLDNARREFIANASHELRTPIFALSGALELLDDEEMDAVERDEFVRSMREQTERLTRLADSLLDLSRLDAGRLHVEQAPVDLHQAAGELVQEFAAAALLSGHALVPAQGRCVVLGDEERVLQIGRGLLQNALRHTPRGSRVEIRVEQRGQTGRLVVADDGPGVPAEHRARIFERFYRVDGGHASGSGLGLAIGREVAQLMGGDVSLETRDGETAFVLALPLAPVAEESPAAADA